MTVPELGQPKQITQIQKYQLTDYHLQTTEKEKHIYMSVAFLGQHCIVEDENAWIMDEKRNKENEFKEMNELKNKDELNIIH